MAKGLCMTHYGQMRKGRELTAIRSSLNATRRPRNASLGEVADSILRRCVLGSNGCLLWPGATSNKGYGVIRVDGKVRQTHAVVMEAIEGARPEGMETRHACDIKRCCNPDHLSYGTPRENTRDKLERGARGNGTAKLWPEQIREIRSKLARGESQQDLAKEYGVHSSLISMIGSGARWSWVQ